MGLMLHAALDPSGCRWRDICPAVDVLLAVVETKPAT